MASLLVEKGMKLESTLDFSRVTAEIRRVWLRIVLFVVLVSALALPFIIGMTPVYQASATLLFRAEAENVSPVENVYRFDSTRKEYYDTQFQILQSRRIAEQVVDKLGLAALPEFAGGAKGGLLSRVLGRSASTPVSPDLARRHAVDWLLKHLTVTPIRNTQMAAVTFESPNAKQASQIANAVAQAYIDFSIEQRLAATLQASQWNKNRLAELSRQITAQEKSLNDFLQRNGLITFRGVDGLQTEELGIITNKLADAREQRIAALAQYQAITKSDGSYIADLSAIPEASSHPQIQDLRIALIKAQENLAELTRVYGDKFDKVQQAKAQVAAIRAQTQVVLKEIADGIYQRYQAALKKEQQFQQALVQKKAQFSQLAEQTAEYDNLKNNLNKTRELYNAFYQRQQETQANSTYTEASATLFEPAEQPLHPSKPNKPLFLIMVAAFSGVLAVCFVVVKASLANTVDTLTQAERRLGRAPLGEIVRLADSTLTLPDMVRLSSLEPQLSESVDGLRAALLLQPHTYPLLMVSSTATGEGSSTISALLGAALAQDLPTLLIDANLRDGHVSRSFAATGVPGLAEILAGTAEANQAILPATADRPWALLPAGKPTVSPLLALSSERLSALLQALRGYYARIIIDVPAVTTCKDALLVGRYVDGCVYVVKSRELPTNQILSGLQALQQQQITLAGLVLNQVPESLVEGAENLLPAGGQPASHVADQGDASLLP